MLRKLMNTIEKENSSKKRRVEPEITITNPEIIDLCSDNEELDTKITITAPEIMDLRSDNEEQLLDVTIENNISGIVGDVISINSNEAKIDFISSQKNIPDLDQNPRITENFKLAGFLKKVSQHIPVENPKLETSEKKTNLASFFKDISNNPALYNRNKEECDSTSIQSEENSSKVFLASLETKINVNFINLQNTIQKENCSISFDEFLYNDDKIWAHFKSLSLDDQKELERNKLPIFKRTEVNPKFDRNKGFYNASFVNDLNNFSKNKDSINKHAPLIAKAIILVFSHYIVDIARESQYGSIFPSHFIKLVRIKLEINFQASSLAKILLDDDSSLVKNLKRLLKEVIGVKKKDKKQKITDNQLTNVSYNPEKYQLITKDYVLMDEKGNLSICYMKGNKEIQDICTQLYHEMSQDKVFCTANGAGRDIDNGTCKIFGRIGAYTRTVFSPTAASCLFPHYDKQLEKLAQLLTKIFNDKFPAIVENQKNELAPYLNKLIPGSIFSTITVTMDNQTKRHKDKSNFGKKNKKHMGILVILNGKDQKNYSGCHTYIDDHQVKFDMDHADILITRFSEKSHGNTDIIHHQKPNKINRFALVFYTHESIEKKPLIYPQAPNSDDDRLPEYNIVDINRSYQPESYQKKFVEHVDPVMEDRDESQQASPHL